MKNYFLAIFVLFFLTACETEVKKKETEHSCIDEYKQYNDTVSAYKIRMESLIQAEGCKVIPLYAYIIEAEEFDILNKVDDSPKIMENLIKLFETNKVFFSVIMKHSTMKKILLTNRLNDDFIEKFTYIVRKKLHKKQIIEIDKNRNYLNYLLLASLYAKDKKETLALYTQLKSSLSIEIVPSFVLVLDSIGDQYSFEELVENFTILTKKLSIDEVKVLALYPQYFAYFLYPKKEVLDIGSISDSKLREIQQSIQQKVIDIYQQMFAKYRYTNGVSQIDYALLTVENIYPYLLEQESVSNDDFSQLFHHLVEKGYILSLFQKDKCSKTTKEHFAVFGQHNIQSAVKLLKKEKFFAYSLFDEFKDPNYSINSFFYVANLYKNLNNKEWKIFKKLLVTLPYAYDNKIAFIQRIEKNGYFRNIVQQDDYKEMIVPEYGEKNPKYKYVLLTPYPSQNDENIFESVLRTDISDNTLQKSLVDLIGKSSKELAIHEFTTSEKFFGNVDKLDNIVTVASVVLVPFTAGTSLSYIALKVGVKQASKQGAKYMMKKIALKSRKIFTKKMINQSNKHVDKIYNSISPLNMVGELSTFSNSDNQETKTICQE